jgi:class 3 adenylate cyclase
MLQAGYRDVAVLRGGLEAWTAAGLPVAPLPDPEIPTAVAWMDAAPEARAPAPEGAAPTNESLFLPRIAGQSFLEGLDLPVRREMAVLFVDMVGSTRLVFERSPEEVLAVMQAFMEVVIDVGAYHCGDVHDFEGDGALLYFEGAGEAVPAAFRLRDALARRREENEGFPQPRLSLDAGPIVLGVVGTRFRRTVSLVGPSLHTAARILKLAPPGGISATETVVAQARVANPLLAREFQEMGGVPPHLEAELGPLRVWIAPPPESHPR